jgi:7-cyano-7-deazaguanine synthase in queuosine biosynthesis
MRFLVDGLSVSAFFRPPEAVAAMIDSDGVSLLAGSILCDLAAEVRPKEVEIKQPCLTSDFGEVFSDAVYALMAEEDAYWRRSRFLSAPIMHGCFANRKPSNEPLDPNKVVLGFSGGKDSIVSLFALLEAGYEVLPVLVNEGDRTWQDLRKWIPKLTKLGLQTFVPFLSTGSRKQLKDFYGNWYFSSYQIGWLVATLALCATALRARTICLGIEASADLSWRMYRGRQINHQHQKTGAHLRLLEKFYRRALNPQIRIRSPIANLTDTEVVKVLLSKVPESFQEFSSCGASNSRSKHCGTCTKCAFIYPLLCASSDGRQLANRIFHTMPLEEENLYQPWLDSRFLLPPGCIGQKVEVWSALEVLVREGFKAPVVHKWKRSSLRRRLLSNGLDRDGHLVVAPARSSLTRAVAQASRLVKAWSTG